MNPRDIPVRFSSLHHIARSPAHYLYGIENERKTTPAMALGRLVHSLVLGGAHVVYDGERRGKAWTEFAESHSGTEIYTASELARATPMAEAVAAHELATELLEGEHEREVLWRGLNGRACASHLDVLHPRRVVELKTSVDTEPGRFGRLALRMGYHAQLAFYVDAANWERMAAARTEVDPEPPHRIEEAYIVAVEAAAPHVITIHRLTRKALDEGRKLCRLWMEELLGCEESGRWPGYCESIVDLDVPEEVDLLFEGDAA